MPSQAHRTDPYKNYKFRVKWDGRYVAGVSRVGALTRSTAVVKHRSGGDQGSSRLSPGQTEYGPITLERGVTHDPEFERWARQVWPLGRGGGGGPSPNDFRKDVRIELLDEAGRVVLAYHVYRCWVSEYTVLPSLDASGNEVLIESITLQHEGWERDEATVEPREG